MTDLRTLPSRKVLNKEDLTPEFFINNMTFTPRDFKPVYLKIGQPVSKAVIDRKINVGRVYRDDTLKELSDANNPLSIVPLYFDRQVLYKVFEGNCPDKAMGRNIAFASRPYTLETAKDIAFKGIYDPRSNTTSFAQEQVTVHCSVLSGDDFERDSLGGVVTFSCTFAQTSLKAGRKLVSMFLTELNMQKMDFNSTKKKKVCGIHKNIYSISVRQEGTGAGSFFLFDTVEKIGATPKMVKKIEVDTLATSFIEDYLALKSSMSVSLDHQGSNYQDEGQNRTPIGIPTQQPPIDQRPMLKQQQVPMQQPIVEQQRQQFPNQQQGRQIPIQQAPAQQPYTPMQQVPKEPEVQAIAREQRQQEQAVREGTPPNPSESQRFNELSKKGIGRGTGTAEEELPPTWG